MWRPIAKENIHVEVVVIGNLYRVMSCHTRVSGPDEGQARERKGVLNYQLITSCNNNTSSLVRT